MNNREKDSYMSLRSETSRETFLEATKSTFDDISGKNNFVSEHCHGSLSTAGFMIRLLVPTELLNSRKFIIPIVLRTADVAIVTTRALHWKATAVGTERAESAWETVQNTVHLRKMFFLVGSVNSGFILDNAVRNYGVGDYKTRRRSDCNPRMQQQKSRLQTGLNGRRK
jgi:hypothetical protein